MKYLSFLFLILSIGINAQIIELNIVDYSNQLPIDDADLYFKKSTKNFISNIDGNAVIDISEVNKDDELLISKKDFQNAMIKVSDLKSNMIIKLEKVSEIELQEAFVTNLKAVDILKKVIENYNKNFTTEEHFYLVNFKRDAFIDTVNRDLIDVDLQFRFKKDNLKIHSNNKLNEKIIGEGMHQKWSFSMLNFFNNISLLDVVKRMQLRFVEKKYTEETVLISKYADKDMYELEFKNLKGNVTNWFLIDKETFAIVEHKAKQENTKFEKSGDTIIYYDVIYKYRPYQGKWILKESSSTSSTEYLDDLKNKHILDVKVSLEIKDFSNQPFLQFNKSVNEKIDIRKSFK